MDTTPPPVAKYETCPVFTPSLKQMKDFSGYLKFLEKQGVAKHGLCKIVPPKDWPWKFKLESSKSVYVDTPIMQCASGRAGVLKVANLIQPGMTIGEFKAFADKHEPRDVVAMTKAQDWFEIERKYWRSLTTTSDPPMYGADHVYSLFGDAQVPFNVNHLECMLKKCGVDVPGVTKPMVYVGMWRALFAWHTEDLNMFSINFLHHGKPKMWYALAAHNAARFETLAKGLNPDETCPEFLRHKTTLISPMRLHQAGIEFVRAVQQPGEIMITWPQAYHSGFNLGFNIAESVNFIPPSLWEFYIEYAKKARVCNCRPDSVKINIGWLEKSFQRGRPLNPGEESSEDEGEEETAPVGRRLAVKKPKVGEVVEYWCMNEWLPVTIVSVLDDYIKVHEAGSKSSDDAWVSLDSPELRRAQTQPPKRVRRR